MALDRITLFGLAAIFTMLAATASLWWLAGVAAVGGLYAFDAWARRGAAALIADPLGGEPLPVADATAARNPPYVIGDFLAACCCDCRAGALVVTAPHIAEIVRQCARECRRVGLPEPPMVQVLNALEPFCAGCGQPYSPALLRQAWRDATAKGGVELRSGLLPDEDGRCPKCGDRTIVLVFDP